MVGADPRLNGDVVISGSGRVDVHTPDDVSGRRVEDRECEPCACFEVSGVAAKVGEVLVGRHPVDRGPVAVGKPRSRPDVIDARRPRCVVGEVVLRTEPFQQEIAGHERSRGLEVGGDEPGWRHRTTVPVGSPGTVSSFTGRYPFGDRAGTGKYRQMPFATFRRVADSLVVATAIHNGHDLRTEVAELVALDESTRLREEDPFTDFFAEAFPISAVACHSRFEADLNRPVDEAVYTNAEDAWDLEVWKHPPTPQILAESQRAYTEFYDDLAVLLDACVLANGGFILYDIHSYNHRRNGPSSDPAPAIENPVVNLGTGSLPPRWELVAETFIDSLASQALNSEAIDVRQNVKFKGRQMAAWVHERYGDTSCALAIELKKVWMDEWTGVVDERQQNDLRLALLGTVESVSAAWSKCVGN